MKETAFEQLSFVDDVEKVREMIDAEKDEIPSLTETIPDDTDDDEPEQLNEYAFEEETTK